MAEKAILVVSDSSGLGLGGVPVFNRDLSVALAAGREVYLLTVVAAGKNYLDELNRLKRDHPGVKIALVENPTNVPDDELRTILKEAVENNDRGSYGLPKDKHDIGVIIGHSRFSGPAAVAAKKHWYSHANVAHILHTSPMRLGQIKGAENIAKGMDNAKREITCLNEADLGVGIGRLLFDVVTGLRPERDKPRAHELISGVKIDANPVELKGNKGPEEAIELLLLGRATDPVKDLVDAISAVRILRRGGTFFNGDGEIVIRANKVKLRVRGVPQNEVAAVQQWANVMGDDNGKNENPVVEILPFVSDQEQIVKDIRAADTVIVPSHTEGFPLAALEAVGHGVPILVSQESGVSRFLLNPRRINSEVGGPCVVRDENHAGNRPLLWAKAIQDLKENLHERYKQARALREALTHYSWQNAADALLDTVTKWDKDTTQAQDGEVRPAEEFSQLKETDPRAQADEVALTAGPTASS